MQMMIGNDEKAGIMPTFEVFEPEGAKRDLMKPTITSEVVVAYAQCPRKAYLILFSPGSGEPHEYERILERQRREHQEGYLDRLKQKHADVQPYTENLGNGSEMLINACLQADGFAAVCDVLTRVEGKSIMYPENWTGN